MNSNVAVKEVNRSAKCIDGRNFEFAISREVAEQNPPEPKLKKDGTPKVITHNKKKDVKSEVYAFEPEDIKKILEYFEGRKMWLQYLLFVVSCNLARRAGDILNLTWGDFYNAKTGAFKNDMEIKEEKTGKLSVLHINSAVKDAIQLYIEQTHCDPSKDNYSVPICYQLSGTHKGTPMSYSGWLKSLKRAAEETGFQYNAGTHSARKTFGKTTRMLHPNDKNSMELLCNIYRHSDTRMTSRYIGLTKEQTDGYFNDMGDFFNDYIVGDKELQKSSASTIVSLDANDLKDIIALAYEAGKDNAQETDAMVHVNAISELLKMIDEFQK